MPPTPPSGVDHPYAFLVVFLVVAILFPLAPLLLARLWARFFAPPKPGAQKNATYECGLESKGDAMIQFKSHYYLYAIIFLIFDVETVFLLPFAVRLPAFLPAPSWRCWSSCCCSRKGSPGRG